jgi:TctA family transporter
MAAGTGALLLVLLTTGSAGLAICAVCTAIGLLPLLYGSRRMNCLGVILLPLAINMTGHAPALRSWLGL